MPERCCVCDRECAYVPVAGTDAVTIDTTLVRIDPSCVAHPVCWCRFMCDVDDAVEDMLGGRKAR